jgi:hypothetical protein
VTFSRLLRCSSTASKQPSWNKRHCRKRRSRHPLLSIAPHYLPPRVAARQSASLVDSNRTGSRTVMRYVGGLIPLFLQDACLHALVGPTTRPWRSATDARASLVAAPVRSTAPVRRHQGVMSGLDHPERRR